MTHKRTGQEVRALLSHERPWLFRLALAITGRRDMAEDVAQETLLRAMRSLPALQSADEPKAWLRVTLVRCAMTALAAKKPSSEAESAVAPDPTESIAVRQTLDRLDPVDRAVLALSHFEGLSYAEISQALDIPIGTVGSRLHAAREAFRKEWRK